MPTPAPAPTPSNLPVVTKNPTDEKVAVNGACQFVTKYENAKWAEWHFVSPDGSRDLDYLEAQKEFPSMNIIKGFSSQLDLEGVPEALNGWKVYCRFSNDFGAVKTERASITVTSSPADAPKVTKSPTGEIVPVGGAADFVARHEGAYWALWHFVAPDGGDITYQDAQSQFPALGITGGDQSTLHLKNIPAELNGWKVYCAFSNNVGTVNTEAAAITVGTPQNVPVQSGTTIPAQGGTAGSNYYSGNFVSDRATMEIFSTGVPGNYTIKVHWGSGATLSSDWTFTGSFDNLGILNYTDGKLTITDYDTNTVTTQYENGTGKLVYVDSGVTGVYWTDNNMSDQINDKFFTRN